MKSFAAVSLALLLASASAFTGPSMATRAVGKKVAKKVAKKGKKEVAAVSSVSYSFDVYVSVESCP
jgi:hypothetical protein